MAFQPVNSAGDFNFGQQYGDPNSIAAMLAEDPFTSIVAVPIDQSLPQIDPATGGTYFPGANPVSDPSAFDWGTLDQVGIPNGVVPPPPEDITAADLQASATPGDPAFGGPVGYDPSGNPIYDTTGSANNLPDTIDPNYAGVPAVGPIQSPTVVPSQGTTDATQSGPSTGGSDAAKTGGGGSGGGSGISFPSTPKPQTQPATNPVASSLSGLPSWFWILVAIMAVLFLISQRGGSSTAQVVKVR